MQFPGVEKGGPVNALNQLLHGHVIARIVTAAAAAHGAVQTADGNRPQPCGHGGNVAVRRPLPAQFTGFLQGQEVADGLVFMPVAQLLLPGLHGGDVGILLLAHQGGGRGHHLGGVYRVHHGALVMGGDFQGRMQGGRSGATHHQGNGHPPAFHLRGHVGHLLQGRGDQAGKHHQVRLFRLRPVQNGITMDHHAQVNHLKTVAPQHHAHDILADVVHVPLHGGDYGLPRLGGALAVLFNIRGEPRHGLLHHAGALHHLRQEHLAVPEQLAHGLHAVHQRAFNHAQRGTQLLERLRRIRVHKLGNALDKGILQAFGDVLFPPFQHGLLLRSGLRLLRSQLFRVIRQSFRGVRIPVQQHIFNQLQPVLGNIIVHLQHAGIHDAHIQPLPGGVVQESGMHGLPHRVVPAEGKGHIGNAAGNVGVRQVLGNPARGLEEIQGVIGVLRNPGADGQHVRVKNNILRRELHAVHQQVISPFADADAVVVIGSLPLLVKSHHHGRRAVPLNQGRLLQELLFTLLQGNGIHDSLALHALQARFQHFPLGGIHHERDAGDIRLRGNEIKKADHGLGAVDQAVVKTEIQHHGSILHLLAGNGYRFLIIPFTNQARKFGGTRHIAAFPHKKGILLPRMIVRLITGQAQHGLLRGWNAGSQAFHGSGNGADMFRRGAAAAAHDIQQAQGRVLLHEPGHVLRKKVVAGGAERVGKPGIRVNGHVAIRQAGKLLRKGAHQVRPQGAIDAHGKRADVTNGIPERFNRLAGQRASGLVRQRDGHHDRNGGLRLFLKNLFNGEQGRLGVQRVENRLHQQHVHSSFQQGQNLVAVGLPQLAEIHGPEAGIVHVRGQGAGNGHGTDGAGHKARPAV